MKFKLWPEPGPGLPSGPTNKQKLLFIENLPDNPEDPFFKRPHYHNVDTVLFIGGARSGKTLSSCIRVIKYLLDNPGSTAILGATNRPLLFRSVVKVWQEVFSDVTPWDHLKLPNRLITRKPTMTEPRIDFTNGSVAYFLHFSDPEILKGIDADICEFEEADLIRDEGAFEELLARLSGKKGPLRQLILTTNPVRASRGWIRDKFKLWQMKPDYKGPLEPIVDPCSCHLCQQCLNAKYGEWEFIDSSGNISTTRGSTCPNPGCKKIQLIGKPEAKDNDCPGNQVFYRVIQTSSVDNIHIPSDYAQSASRGMSEATAAAMVRGEINENIDGLVYSAFTDNNILKVKQKVDLNKDLIWSLDFNYDPQCSVVCQETETEDGFNITVIDEIVKWNALPEHVAKEFCMRYHKFKGTDREVYLYSDPAGLYGGGKDLKPTFYQTIVDILRKPSDEFGEYDPHGQSFKVKIMMRIDPKPYTDKTREKVKINVAERIDATNAMLRNDLGEIRLFVNQSCRYLISSFEGVSWAADGQSIDKKIDEYAKKKSKDIVRAMTHPGDSIGYYIAKRFPLIRNKAGIQVFQVPGESSIVYKSGRFEERIRTEHIAKETEKRMNRDQARLERKKDKLRAKLEKQNQRSFFNLIDGLRKSPTHYYYF